MKAVILAGGFGSRLKEISRDIPKPMVSIAGKPFLEHQINFLREYGIKEVIITVHYMANKIKSYFGDGLRWDMNITYCEEESPLGTGGAIKNAEQYIDDTFLVLNGDSYSQIDLKRFMEFHKNMNNICTMSLTKSTDSSYYGNVILENNKIKEFSEKKADTEGLINTGIYIFEPKIFDYIIKSENVSLEKDIFPKLSKEGTLGGYQYEGYFMDIGRPETYKKFKEDVIKTLFLKENDSVMEAMKKIHYSEINLVIVVNEENKLVGVLTERIIKKFLISGGKLEYPVKNAMITDPITTKEGEENEIRKLLLRGINALPILNENGKVVDVRFRSEKLKEEKFSIIRGRAPLRISFAGGGTDLPHFFEKYGGAVISATINKYCYGTIIKRADSKIIIDSDLSNGLIINSINELKYDGNLDLIKAVIKIINPEFGFELYLHNDIPPGRGLGSSASLAVLIVNLIGQLQGTKYSDYDMAKIAYKAEDEELKITGGWQDQYAAVSGGFNFMEFDQDKSLIYPLRLKEDFINELNHHLLLCYIGQTHDSGKVQDSIIKNESDKILGLYDIKNKAIEMRDSLLTGDLSKIGRLLHESWEKKKNLSQSISNERVNMLYDLGLKNGAVGGKLLGAGGGGYILFFHNPTKKNLLMRSLKNVGAEIMDFQFEFGGTKIWSVDK